MERRFIFKKGPISIGRAYSNDIILDDPFVSNQHILITRNNGNLFVSDLKSENGTKINQHLSLKGQSVKLGSGNEIYLGKTRLKVFLPDHPIVPTKKFQRFTNLRELFDKNSVAIGFSLFVLGIMIWAGYLEKPSQKYWKEGLIEAVLSYGFGALFYVIIVGFIINLKTHKVFYKRHLAVSNFGTLVYLIYEALDPFIAFWLPNINWVASIDYILNLAIFLGMFWASIQLTKDLIKPRDYLQPVIISLILLFLTAWGEQKIQFAFSRKPAYSAKLAPYLKPITEPVTLDQFLEDSGSDLFKSGKK